MRHKTITRTTRNKRYSDNIQHNASRNRDIRHTELGRKCGSAVNIVMVVRWNFQECALSKNYERSEANYDN